MNRESIYNLVPIEYEEPPRRPPPKSDPYKQQVVPYSTFGKLLVSF